MTGHIERIRASATFLYNNDTLWSNLSSFPGSPSSGSSFDRDGHDVVECEKKEQEQSMIITLFHEIMEREELF